MPRFGGCRRDRVLRVRTAAGRALSGGWWACALSVGGFGLAVGLLTPGAWLVSVGVLSALLGTMAATGIAGWRDTPLTVALVVRAFGCWALGFIALVGLSRLLGQGVPAVLAALGLTGVPLALPAARRYFGTGSPTVLSAAARVRRALELDVRTADLPVLRQLWQSTQERVQLATDPYEVGVLADVRARYLDEFERRDPAGFDGWLAADRRWLDLIAPAGSTDGPSWEPRP